MNNKAKVSVEIMSKDGILDPQGEGIRQALETLGFSGIKSVRQGKLIEIIAEDEEDIEARVEDMCKQLLVNPVMETSKIFISHRTPHILKGKGV